LAVVVVVAAVVVDVSTPTNIPFVQNDFLLSCKLITLMIADTKLK
jgi:hypothetical protein